MKVIIVGKSAYCTKINFCNVSIDTPLVMAGHTIQLIRPLVTMLQEHQSQVALVFPIENVDDEAIIYDAQDKVPDEVILSPYTSRAIPKSIHQSGYLELNTAIIDAGDKLGQIDWVLFVNSFPSLLFADHALNELKLKSKGKTKVGVLLRGGDGYKWTQTDFLSNWFQSEEVGKRIQKMYIMSLLRTDFVATASTWLKHIVEAVGITVSEVIPSPPVPLSAQSSDTNKQIITESVTPLWGKIDPFNKWIVVAGRFNPDKCPALAISAFSVLPTNSYQLIFAGAGNVEYIVDLIEDTPWEIHDRIVGITVPPRLLTNLYGAADIVLHTAIPSANFTDARPSAVTSAAFHGKPVVAITGGGITECLSNKNIELLCVNPTKYETKTDLSTELAKCLELMFNKELSQSIGDANAEHSCQNNIQNALSIFLDRLAMSQ